MKDFINELGNQIPIEATEKVINGVDGIFITIEGPNSKTEMHITRREAGVLTDLLNELMRQRA